MIQKIINFFKKKKTKQNNRKRLYVIFDGPLPRDFGTLMGTIFDITDIYTCFSSTNSTHVNLLTDKSIDYIVNNLVLNIDPKYGLGTRHFFLIIDVDTLKLERFITTEVLNQLVNIPDIKYNFNQDKVNVAMNESGERLNDSIDRLINAFKEPIDTVFTSNSGIEDELNQLLDKINERGIDSLTDEERDKMDKLSKK